MVDTMASILDIPFQKEFTEELIPNGEVVRLKTITAENHKSERGVSSLHVVFQPIGFPKAPPLHEYYTLPVNPDKIERSNFDGDASYNEALRNNNLSIRRFRQLFEALGMELRAVDLSNPKDNDLTQRECSAIVKIEDSKDAQYDAKNRIKQFA